MKAWLYGFFMAWGMFLSIPCPAKLWDESARRHMLACLPLVGAVAGGLWALEAWLLALTGCPMPIRAVLIAFFPWLLTGAIHVDGFMDVSDAILSRRDLETRRRILKDPHCGSFAVISIVLLSAAVFALCMTKEISGLALVSLGLIPVSTRACAAIAVSVMRPMSTSQYSSMGEGKRFGMLILPILLLTAACAVPAALCGCRGLAPLASAAVYWLAALYGFKQLDGMNGDISGYALTLGEAAGLAVLVLI
ncbi:MAG: adenosylcobinamide-GDP ribazoletransferase [Clostridia bacterium]|nr:adenosylcobinamide-GDP ribazoletransferase [Clostridia bacterium]